MEGRDKGKYDQEVRETTANCNRGAAEKQSAKTCQDQEKQEKKTKMELMRIKHTHMQPDNDPG